MIEYDFIPAHGPLSAWVEGFWQLSQAAGPTAGAAPIPADACCEAVFHLGAPPIRLGDDAPQAQILFAGPQSGAIRLRQTGPMHARAIRFRPWGAAAFARESLAGLIDRTPDAREALGDLGARLGDAAMAARSLTAFAATATDLLTGALRHAAPAGVEIIGALARAPAAAAFDAGWSERTIRRHWQAATGLTPGLYLRIQRFQRARDRALTGQALARIAHEEGFADQAHMNREFRRFGGQTPRDMMAGSPFDAFYDQERDAHWRAAAAGG